jgi:hypothetical protein
LSSHASCGVLALHCTSRQQHSGLFVWIPLISCEFSFHNMNIFISCLSFFMCLCVIM